MILMNIDQLFLSNLGFVVILKSDGDKRSVPIFIGAAEAQAIAIQMQGVSVPRPLTHDLLKNVLDYLECRLKRVEICDIADNTYYGRLVVEFEGDEEEIDCRPSDAIALALRTCSPIYVSEKVLTEAGRVLDTIVPDEAHGEDPFNTSNEDDPTLPMTPLEILQKKLNEAIEAERYEDAARFRDEIDHLNKHTDN